MLGVPFDFTAKPVVVRPTRPKPTTRVHAVKEREALEITFPRVEGYRVELPEEPLTATFNADSRLVLTPELVGPCRVLLEGIVGEVFHRNRSRRSLAFLKDMSIDCSLSKVSGSALK